MTEAILNSPATVVLDGTGGGTARIGPVSARETWRPLIASVRTNQVPGTVVKEAQCFIYAGAAATPDNFIDATLSGSSGDSTDAIASQVLQVGQYVWAVWHGGDAGVQAWLNVSGTRTVG